jgi:hypothetical protein
MRPAVHENLLPGTMPLHLGRRALDPQIFGREAKTAAVVEFDLEQLLCLL